MIKGAPRAVMIAFFVVGIVLLGFSGWALNTEIPSEQFQADPRFEEEYIKYYQWLMAFGGGLVGSGVTLGVLGKKM
jgi:hypothetical protein